MTKHETLFAALAAPFDPSEVKVRTQANRQLHYITARTAMNRLDDVAGPENWRDEYEIHENSVFCRLSLRLADGEWLTKCDAGGFAGMADSGDDDKSGYSDAFKRAAVKFGVGRYLYRDGVPSFVREALSGIGVSTAPPPEPAQGQPRGAAPAPQREQPPAVNGNVNGNGAAPNGNPPRTGKALFAWTKDQEQRYEVGLLKYLNQWSKLQDFPGRMIDWDEEQVKLAHAEAVRKLRSVAEGSREEAISN